MKLRIIVSLFAVMACVSSFCGAVDFETSANLLTNGGFEQGWFGDWAYQSNVSLSTADSAAGTYCLEASGGTGEVAHAVIDVAEGENLQLSLSYKTLAGVVDSGSVAQLRYYDADSIYLGNDILYLSATNGQWTEFSGAYIAPADAAKADIYIATQTNGTARVDNVAVYPEALYDMGRNLIYNGDAERGNFDNWGHLVGGAIDANDVAEGTYSYRAASASAQFIQYSYAVARDEPILLSLDYKTNPGVGDLSYVYVRYFDGLNYVGQDVAMILTPTNGAWETFSTTMTTPNDPNNFAVLDVFVFAIPKNSRFDNLSMYRRPVVVDTRTNLIHNGDFEQGYIDAALDPAQDPCLVDNAAYLVNLQATDADNTTPGGMYCAEGTNTTDSQYVPFALLNVEPGAIVRVMLNYKTLPGATKADNGAILFVRQYDNTGALPLWLGQEEITFPLTEGAWQEFSQDFAIYPHADTIDVFFVAGTYSAFSGTVRIDDLSVYQEITPTGPDDFGFFAAWLDDSREPPLPDLVVDDFESYANQAQMENFWGNTSGSYPISGTSGAITLLTNPADAYEGSNALRWDYDNAGAGAETWVEFHRVLSSPVDLSLYDQMHVRVNRHPGNSTERQFYLKFYNDTIAEADIDAQSTVIMHTDGSTSTPTGWDTWAIDLNNDMEFIRGATSLADLTDVVGFFFGVVGDAANGQGAGTIDIDEITLVDTMPNCVSGLSEWDYNDDCIVNLPDFAEFAYRWMLE